MIYIIKSLQTLKNIAPIDYDKVKYIFIFQKNEIFLEEYFNKILNFVNLRILLLEVGGNACELQKYDFNKFAILKKIYNINIDISGVNMTFNLLCKNDTMIIRYLTLTDGTLVQLSLNEKRIEDMEIINEIIIEKSIKRVSIFRNSPLTLCHFCNFLPESVEYLQISLDHYYELVKLTNLPSSLKELDIVMDFNSYVLVFEYELDGDIETYDDDESGKINNKKIIIGEEIYNDDEYNDEYNDELIIKNNVDANNKKISVIKSNIKLPFGCKLNFIDRIYYEYRRY